MSDTTIDDLARMVGNGFADVDKRFDAVDKRFDAMQKQMDKRFDTVDKRFDRLEKENEAAHALFHNDISLVWRELKAIRLWSLRGVNDEAIFLDRHGFASRRHSNISFLEKEVEKLKLSH